MDKQEVPKVLRVALYGILLAGGVLSLPRLGAYSMIPVGSLLDAWIVGFIFACIVRGRTYSTYLLMFLVVYLATRIVPAIYISAPLTDFLQAYRWVLYLIAFAFAVGRTWGPTRPLLRVTWILMAMSLAKTAVTIAVLGPSKRSGLLIENNFEIALYSGVVALLYSKLSTRERFWTMLTLGVLVISSGSRSGAVAFAILVVYAITQVPSASLFLRYVLALTVPFAIYFVVQIFESRAESGGVDRLRFLDIFWQETANWSPLTWAFGTTPITPLSNGGCSALSYYVNLFSSSDDGSCYSVILHAFAMRVVFDAGIFGLLVAAIVTAYTLHRGGASGWLTATLVAIALTNSLSVSGLNSPYVALPIVLAIATSTPRTLLRPPFALSAVRERETARR